MTISVVNKQVAENSALSSSFNTSPITTITGRLYIIAIQVLHYPEYTGSDIVSISSAGGVTWTKATSMVLAGLYPVELWYGYCTAGSTGTAWTITLGTTPTTYSSRLYHIDEASGTASSGIIVQSNTAENSTSSPVSTTLSPFSQAGNATYEYCLVASGTGGQTITPEAGYTTVGTSPISTFSILSKTAYKLGEDTTPSYTYTDVGTPTGDIIAVEILFDGTGVGIPNSLMLMGCGT